VEQYSKQFWAIKNKYKQKLNKMKLAQLKEYRDTIEKRLDNSRTFLKLLNSEFFENRDLFFDNDITDSVFENEMVNLYYFHNDKIDFKESFDLIHNETYNLIDSLEKLIDSLNFTIQYEILKK
jgi:hypothetical protein